MRRFFPENGFYRLKMEDKFLPGEDKFIPEGKEANKMTTTLDNEETRRKMYHEVLRIFTSLDQVLKLLQTCLDCISEATKDNDVERLSQFEDFNQNTFNAYQVKQDGFRRQLEEIRETHKINECLAAERDQMEDELE